METKENEWFGKEFAAGKYRIGKALGQGGYAEVFRANEPEIDRDVALKILKKNNEGEYSERLRKRFMREAKLVAGLKDHHTIKLYDYGEEDGYLYLAFEYVEGETLAERLRREGPLKPFVVAKLLEQLLDSLKEAHDRGILHRDIKPANIMLTEHERRGIEVKVLDFGIGKFVREQQKVTQLTAEGRMIGTPRYMAPEQMRGMEDLGPPADLWAVGMVAYECLTGHRAIETDDAMAMTTRILDRTEFRMPEDVDVPQFLRDMVEKLLRKDEGRRYQNAGEVLRDLDEFRTRATVELQEQKLERARVALGKEGAANQANDDEPTPAERPSARPNKEAEEKGESRGRYVAVGLALVVLVAIGAWWSSGGGAPNTEVPAFLKKSAEIPVGSTSTAKKKADVDKVVPVATQSDKNAVEKDKGPKETDLGKSVPTNAPPTEKVVRQQEDEERSAAKRRISKVAKRTKAAPDRNKVADKAIAAESESAKEKGAESPKGGDIKASPKTEEMKSEAKESKPTKLRVWGVE